MIRKITLVGRETKGKMVSNFFKKLAMTGVMPHSKGAEMIMPLFVGEDITICIDVSEISDDSVEFLTEELDRNSVPYSVEHHLIVS